MKWLTAELHFVTRSYIMHAGSLLQLTETPEQNRVACTNTSVPSTELSPTSLGAQSDENVCFVLNVDSSKTQYAVIISPEVPYLQVLWLPQRTLNTHKLC